MNITDYLRAQDVKRWHIVCTRREQSIAEHSFNVALISMELYKRTVGTQPAKLTSHGLLHKSISFDMMLRMALFHDIPEVVLGDFPTISKALLKKKHGEHIFEDLEHEACPELAELSKNLDPTLKKIVKAADYIDGILYIQQNGAKNHARRVASFLEKRFSAFLSEWYKEDNRFDWEQECMSLLLELRLESGATYLEDIYEAGM